MDNNKMGRSKILAYIDLSNIYIEGQVLEGYTKYNKDGRRRINLRALKHFLTSEFGSNDADIKIMTYGSTKDSEFLKKMQKRGISMKLRKGKEKCVDTSIVRDATRDILENKDSISRLIVVSGDYDLSPLAELSLEYNIDTCLVGWRHSMSRQYTDYNVNIVYLDDYAVEYKIMFTNYHWRGMLPSKAVAITLSTNQINSEDINEYVKGAFLSAKTEKTEELSVLCANSKAENTDEAAEFYSTYWSIKWVDDFKLMLLIHDYNESDPHSDSKLNAIASILTTDNVNITDVYVTTTNTFKINAVPSCVGKVVKY